MIRTFPMLSPTGKVDKGSKESFSTKFPLVLLQWSTWIMSNPKAQGGYDKGTTMIKLMQNVGSNMMVNV